MATKSTLKKPVWLKYNEAEIKEIVLKIAEKKSKNRLKWAAEPSVEL